MSRELQPSVLSLSLVKIEPPTGIKNEPPESEIVEIGIDDILNSLESEEEIISDLKEIDIVYHPVCEKSIKSEILESYHCKSVETQVLVKAENSPFIKTENISQRNKTEDTSNENVTKGTGQAVVEVQASNEYSNALSNLETDEQSILNFSKDLSERFIRVGSRKSKNPNKTDFAECYKTDDTTLWEKEKEKLKVIKAPVIPVEAHEYTSLAKDKHVCNHCQRASNTLSDLKKHIKKIHREVTTMYLCPYCPYKSKWSVCLKNHIIRKHKDTKDIQWHQCNLCEMKFKLKYGLTEHMKVHLKHKQIQDGLDLKRHHCDQCHYKTYKSTNLKNHKINHLKPEDIEYFYCYHCSHKNKHKQGLKKHIFWQHFKNEGKRHHCDKCEYKTYASTALKRHKLTHLKPEEIQYFYCYHCSYKSIQKMNLKRHILKHFKNEEIRFHCYICDFVRLKRNLIIEHIRKHFKNRNKYDETISKYQLESRINNLKKKGASSTETSSHSSAGLVNSHNSRSTSSANSEDHSNYQTISTSMDLGRMLPGQLNKIMATLQHVAKTQQLLSRRVQRNTRAIQKRAMVTYRNRNSRQSLPAPQTGQVCHEGPSPPATATIRPTTTGVGQPIFSTPAPHQTGYHGIQGR